MVDVEAVRRRDAKNLRLTIAVVAAVVVGPPVGLWAYGKIKVANNEAAVKHAVAAQLRDPSSAQFRNVKTHLLAVCGEVNGKNAYGAYSGFSRFYGDAGNVKIEPSPEQKPGEPFSDQEWFDRMWSTSCS